MPEVATRINLAELRRQLDEVPDTNFWDDPDYMSTALASQVTGLCHKKLHAMAKQGKLWMHKRSARWFYFRTAEILALARELERENARPDKEGYRRADEAAAYLAVHRETVRRMVKDGRLMPPKIINGRPYYAQGNLDEALHRLNYMRRMDVRDVSQLTGLKERFIWAMVRSDLFVRPNRDSRFLRGEVFAWWDAWLGTQSPFDDEDRNRRLRTYMEVVAQAEDQERTWALAALKRDLDRKNKLRNQRQNRSPRP